MRIPKSVKVGGHVVKIEAVEMQDFGDYDRAQGLIRINKGAAEDQKKATLLHELLHAIWGEAGLSNKYKAATEEEIVVALESLLFQVLVDNPKVVSFITHKATTEEQRLKRLENTKRWQRANPAKVRHNRQVYRVRKYGMSLEQFESMKMGQEHKCAICGTPFAALPPKAVHIDHKKGTKYVRGVLCTNCNTGIGQLKHDPELLRKAASYLT